MFPDFFGNSNPIAPIAHFGAATPFMQRQQQIAQAQQQRQQQQPVRTPAPQSNNNQPVRTAARQQQQKQQPHASIMHDLTHNPLTNFIGNDIVKPTAKGAAKFVNQGYQEGKQVVDTTRMQAAAATHNPVAFQHANAQSQRDYAGFGNKGGIGNQGTITTRQEAQQGTARGAEKIVGDTALLGSWLIPGGGGVATKGLPIFERMGINAAKGAVTGGVYGAGSAMFQGQNAKNVIKNTALNAAAGGALGAGGTAAAAGIKRALPSAAKVGNFLHNNAANAAPGARTAPGPGAKGADALNGAQRAPQAGSKNVPKGKEDTFKFYSTPVEGGKTVKTGNKVTQAVGKIGSQFSSNNKPEIGSKVHAADRSNFGTVQAHNSDGTVKVQFINPDSGAKATKNFKPSDLSSTKLGAKVKQAANGEKQTGGDYQAANIRAQAAHNELANRGYQVQTALSKLSDTEKGKFWHYVENPGQKMSGNAKEAVTRWRDLADHAYTISQALGGNTKYILNYAMHNWDLPENITSQKDIMKVIQNKGQELNLADSKDVNKLVNMIRQQTGKPVKASDFSGINNIARKYQTISEGKAAGLKLANAGDPGKDVQAYTNSVANSLRRQALIKGYEQADAGMVKNAGKPFVFGDGKQIELSDQARENIKGFEKTATTNKLAKGYDTLNRGGKRTLLSVSQFHPTNIGLLQIAPQLAALGHPILAGKAAVGTYAAAIPKVSDRIMQKAINDGTIDKAARMGNFIRENSDFATAGKLTSEKASGEDMIFKRQIPAAQVQQARGAIKNLKNMGVDINSKAARETGNTDFNVAGFVNTEGRGYDPRLMKTASRVGLAPQFTLSKYATLGKALNPVNDIKTLASGGKEANIAGAHARAAVVGKLAAETGIGLAGSAALGGLQGHSPSDIVKTELTHPAIYTNMKDNKGNTVKFGMPHNFISEPANLVTDLQRGQNGQLQIKPASPTQIGANLRQYGQGRLAILPGIGEQVATNRQFGDKPLHQDNVPAGTKAEQAATSIINSHLPIGLQGIAQTKAVSSHLPGNVQNILNDTKPAGNPVVKGGLAAVGLNESKDQTTGKGLQTKQYFDAVASAKAGLNANDLAAYNSIHQQSKDPVTGAYVIKPTYFDGPAKALLYEQHPNVLAADNKLNAQLAANGQKVDPFYKLSPEQQKAVLAKEANTTLDAAQTTHWLHDNNSWYQQYAKDQQNYFNSLPKADPNRPKSPIQYPTVSSGLKAQLDTYNGYAQGSKESTTYLNTHPDVVNYFNDMVAADNAIRVARGYAAYKTAPQAGKPLQDFMTKYQQADKGTRASLRNSNPRAYQAMIAFYDNSSLHTIAKDSGVNNLVGEPDTTTPELKAIASLAPDIYKTQGPNPSYSVQPAAWLNPASTAGLTQAVNTGNGSGGSYAGSKTAGGYPVFHAPTTFGSEYSKLAGALSKSTHISKPKNVSYEAKAGKPIKPGKVQKVSFGKLPRGERVPGIIRPSRAIISQSKKTGQRIRLSV